MKRYTDDKTGAKIPPGECTILKINGGPLKARYGSELHLDHATAERLIEWLTNGREVPITKVRRARSNSPDRHTQPLEARPS